MRPASARLEAARAAVRRARFLLECATADLNGAETRLRKFDRPRFRIEADRAFAAWRTASEREFAAFAELTDALDAYNAIDDVAEEVTEASK